MHLYIILSAPISDNLEINLTARQPIIFREVYFSMIFTFFIHRLNDAFFPPLTTTAGAGGIVVSIAAFQAVDPGSIPGQRILLFYLFHDFSFLPKSNHDIGGLQYQCESLQGIHFLAGYPQEDMKR